MHYVIYLKLINPATLEPRAYNASLVDLADKHAFSQYFLRLGGNELPLQALAQAPRWRFTDDALLEGTFPGDA
jgi:hypothetical protein